MTTQVCDKKNGGVKKMVLLLYKVFHFQTGRSQNHLSSNSIFLGQDLIMTDVMTSLCLEMKISCS